jgi:hypothetical protein
MSFTYKVLVTIEAPNMLEERPPMCTVSSVKIDTGWLYQVIGCTIGKLGMEVQYASPWTTPTCIVTMSNAASNVAVGFPAIPRLPVTITTMSISFLI